MRTPCLRPMLYSLAAAALLGLTSPAPAQERTYRYDSRYGTPPPVPYQERIPRHGYAEGYGQQVSPEALVESWYRNYLGVVSVNPLDVEFWSNRLRAGFTEKEVLARMLSDPGYQARLGGDRNFIRHLYQQLLGRAPTPAEVDQAVSRYRLDTSLMDDRGARVALIESILGQRQ